MCHTRTPKPPSNYPTAPQGSPTNWWGSLFSHESRSHTPHRRDGPASGMPRASDAVRGRGTGARPTAYTPGSGRLPPTCAQRGNFGHVISDMSFRGGLMYKFLAPALADALVTTRDAQTRNKAKALTKGHPYTVYRLLYPWGSQTPVQSRGMFPIGVGMSPVDCLDKIGDCHYGPCSFFADEETPLEKEPPLW